MQLSFEYTQDLGEGYAPQAVHMMDNKIRLIYLDSESKVLCKETDPVLGIYASLEFTLVGRVSPDKQVSHPSLKKVAHYGAYGFWSSDGDHKFIQYMLPVEITKSFIEGTLSYNIGNEVSQLSASFLNLRGELINRNRSLVTPSTKLEVYYSISTMEISLGQFYVDRASCTYPEQQVTVSARNGIGKLLKEQYFDEDCEFTGVTLQENLQTILSITGIEKYFVAASTKTWKLKFEPQLSILDGLKQVVKQIPKWKIDETLDGTVGIGPYTDTRFDQPGRFTFYRDKTCWGYDVEYDDTDSYSRVCVKCSEPVNSVYLMVPYNKWWVSPPKRTMYVDVADGTSLSEMQEIAEDLAQSISLSGRIENFVGIFTPQLILGDEIKMVDEKNKSEVIGTVTSLKHHLGKKGFYTEFSTDSGGRKGKPRLSDLMSKLSGTASTKGVKIST